MGSEIRIRPIGHDQDGGIFRWIFQRTMVVEEKEQRAMNRDVLKAEHDVGRGGG